MEALKIIDKCGQCNFALKRNRKNRRGYEYYCDIKKDVVYASDTACDQFSPEGGDD